MDTGSATTPPSDRLLRWLGLGLCAALAAAAFGQWTRQVPPLSSAGKASPLGTAAEQAAWSPYNGLAYAAYGRADYAEAVAQQRRAAVAALRAPGPDQPDTAWAVMNLGRCHFALAKADPSFFPLAARDYAWAARMFAASGMEAEAWNSRVWQGEILCQSGQTEAALPILASAWEQARSIPASPTAMDRANSSAGWLVSALRQRRRGPEADRVSDDWLAFTDRLIARGQPVVPPVCELWEERALDRIGEGRWPEAIRLATRAVEARERWLHAPPAAAPASEARAALGNAQYLLGRALEGDGQYTVAERPLRDSLLNRTAAFGPDHLKVAESLVTLMNTYGYLGRFMEARPLAEQALAIEAKAYPRADDPERVDTYLLAADAFARVGAEDRAEGLYRQALTMLLARPGHPEDRSLSNAYDSLGRFLYGKGRRPEAIGLYRRELEISQRLGVHGDRERADLAASYNNIGRALLEENRLAEADAALTESLRLTDAIPGGRARPDSLGVVSNLALLRAEQGRYPESETLFREALEGRVRAFGFQHPKVAYTLRGVARLYALTGRPVQAREAAARAEAILAAVR